MKNWRDYLTGRTIVYEDHYIHYHTQYDTFNLKIRYTRHNGFTLLLVVADGTHTSVFGQQFLEWLELNSRYTIRYDKPGWWKRIRFNRRKKLVTWAVGQIEAGYREFTNIAIDQPIKK